jgi:hypothetical protein
LVKTTAAIDMIESDVQVIAAEAKEELKRLGDYVDYAQGQDYVVEPGVLTFGERSPEGMIRMVYMYPEEYPELYALRAKKREVAELGLRRVMDILQKSPGAQ